MSVPAATALTRAFERRYGAAPTAVGRAPGRVNLIGEHTDYNGGLVLPVALRETTSVRVRARTDRRLRFVSRQQPDEWSGTIADLAPGTVAGWAAYVAGVLWALQVEQGWDVLVDSTVPVGAGLSSSAALECAVALAVAPSVLPSADRRALAETCIRAETEFVGAPTGGMDQYAALLCRPGHALLIDFDSGEWEHVPLALPGLTLLVTDTRTSHALVDGGYSARRAECDTAARHLRVPTLRQATLDQVEGLTDERLRRRARHVLTEIERVPAVVEALRTCDRARLGELFAASHVSLRDDFEVSTPELDAAVSAALHAGAVAARMTGAGFGGSTISLVPDDRVREVIRAVRSASDRQPGFLVAGPR